MPELVLSSGKLMTYETYGNKGTPVVLIHGSPGTAASWQPVTTQLATQYQVIAINLPGYGGSSRPPAVQETNTNYYVEQVELLLMSLYNQPVFLAGHSYGGNIAFNIALRENVPLAGMTLFEPLLVRVLETAGEYGFFAGVEKTLSEYIDEYGKHKKAAMPKFIDYWYGKGAFSYMEPHIRMYLQENIEKNIANIRAMFTESYTRIQLVNMKTPLLFCYGGRSPSIMYKIGEAVTSLTPFGDLRVIEGTSHNLVASHPKVAARLIEEVIQW